MTTKHTTNYDTLTTEQTKISDTPTTEQTPDQTMIYDATTKANTYTLQTTASLQATTKRPKEGIKANDQIISNSISTNTVNRDDIIPYYVKADNLHVACKINKGMFITYHV